MKFIVITIVLSLFLANLGLVQNTTLDISRFGGKPNADIAQALTSAWAEACNSTTPTKIVIPTGTYEMSKVDIQGPCNAPVEIQVDGIIKAPGDPETLKDAYEWFRLQYVDSFILSGNGVFDGQGGLVWQSNDCHKKQICRRLSLNFGFNFLNNSIVHDITSKDSKSFNVNILGCNNFTFDRFKVIAPRDSPNTDGIHIGRSTGISIINTNLATGDDCVSLGDGSKNVLVQNVTCGPGHGISVGSLGKYTHELPVSGVHVKNCTLTNTTNGVRIKTWPDEPGNITITDMRFEDITMVNVMNPVIIDQEYCPHNLCSKKNPSKIKISQVSIKNIKGTSATPEGVVLICSSGVPCEDVKISDVDLTFNGTPILAKCANVKPLITGIAPSCAA